MYKPVVDEARLNRRPYVVGIVLLLAAAVLWSLNGALIKLIHEEGRGPHGVTIAFYRSLFAGLFLLPLARGRFHTLQKKSSDRKTQKTSPATPLLLFAIRHSLFSLRPAAISCVIFFTLMTVCFVLANIKTKAANAIILQYT